MAGKNQITGGSFQDFEGNVLANGYLTMQLSHDEQESVDPGGVVAGLTLRIPLDANGNIAGSVFVWPNDQLNPANSFYNVNAFRRDGVQAWSSPQFQTVLSSPSPFNVGVWVPTNPPTGGAPVGSILLQTNGINNTNQGLLNLTAGTGITLANSGGSVAINGSPGGLQLGNTLWIPGSATTTDFINIGDFMTGQDNAASVSFPAPTSTTNYAVSLLSNRYHIGLPMFYAGRTATLKATAQLTVADTSTQAAIGLFSSTAWITLGSGSQSIPSGSFVAFNVPFAGTTWHAITSGGGSTTDVNTAVAYSARNLLELDYTPASAVFKINGATVASITTNLPTTAAMGILWYSNHISGAAIQTLTTEFISCVSATV